MYRFEDAFKEAIKDQQESNAVEHLNESIKLAQKCLTHGDFNKYKEEFQKSYESILNDMVAFTNRYFSEESGSLEIYALKMVRYMQRIQDLSVLLNKVTNDANKEKIKNEYE